MSRLFPMLLLLTLLLAPAPAAAAKCKQGKVSWSIAGQKTCRAPLKATAPSAVPAQAQTLVSQALRLTAAEPRKGTRTKVPRKLRTLLRKRAAAIGAFAGRVQNGRTARASGPAQSFTAGGVKATATSSLGDDGTVSISIEATVEAGSQSATVGVEVSVPKTTSAVLCPDRSGKVGPAMSTSRVAMTTSVKGGGKVKVTSTTTDTSTGQVGADGILASVATGREQEIEATQPGTSITIRYTATASGAPGQAGKVSSAPTVSATVRSSDLGKAGEKKAARALATDDAVSGKGAQAAADGAAQAGGLITQQRANWESYDEAANRCVRIVFSPDSGAKMAANSTLAVTGTLTPKAGGATIPAAWTVAGPVGKGSFTGTVDGHFTATSGPYVQGEVAVLAGGIRAASPSGRAQRTWVGDFPARPLPRTFRAGFTSHNTTAQSQDDFTGTVDYVLDGDVQQNPDGSQLAWYKASGGSLLDFHEHFDLGGCSFDGSTAAGTLQSGDVELRVAADGTPAYGFTLTFDVAAWNVPLSGGTQPPCPGSVPGSKRVVLQARGTNSDPFPAPGALTADGHFSDHRENVRGTVADHPPEYAVSADWTISGAP